MPDFPTMAYEERSWRSVNAFAPKPLIAGPAGHQRRWGSASRVCRVEGSGLRDLDPSSDGVTCI